MPRKKSGSLKLAKLPEEQAPVNQNQEVGNMLYKSIIEWYKVERANHMDMDEITFIGLVGATTIQYAAAVAIDLHLDKSKFMIITMDVFDHVYKAAPKFG
jgi:hypothetical protein